MKYIVRVQVACEVKIPIEADSADAAWDAMTASFDDPDFDFEKLPKGEDFTFKVVDVKPALVFFQEMNYDLSLLQPNYCSTCGKSAEALVGSQCHSCWAADQEREREKERRAKAVMINCGKTVISTTVIFGKDTTQPCEHDWDGPMTYNKSGLMSSVTCLHCGVAFAEHAKWPEWEE